MLQPDITLRLCTGGLVEFSMSSNTVKLSTPDEFAKSTLVREVKLVLETKPECRVQFGDTGVGIARYIAGELQWFQERTEGNGQ